MDNQTVRAIADAIVDDYGNGRAVDNLEQVRYPRRQEIVEIIDKLLCIVYGGYYSNREVKLYDTRTGIALMVEDCMYRMQKQIAAVLPEGQQEKAEEITQSFFKSIPAVRALLDTDLQAILDGDPAATNKGLIILCYPGFYAITVYRLAHELFKRKVPMIPRIMSEIAHSATGIDIHPGAEIGEYFFIDHGTGIVVGETTIIKPHVKLYQGVTLGALSTRGGQSLAGVKRHPTIEENVTLYACASVLGNTTIGHDSVIGSNVFITEDLPANSRVSVRKQDLDIRIRKERPTE